VLVRDAGDGWMVLALWAAGGVVVTGVSTGLLLRELPWVRPSRRTVTAALRESWRLFISSAAVTLYTSANAFLLGLLSSTAQTAYFSAGEKLVRAAPRVIAPITTAVYPRVGHLVAHGEEARAARLTRVTVLVTAALSGAVALILVVLAEPIIQLLYGEAFGPSVEILRLLAVLLPVIAISGGLGNLILLTHHRDREIVAIVVTAGLVNIVLAVLIAPRHGAVGMAWVLLVVEGLALAGTVLAVRAQSRRVRHAG